MCVCVFLTQRDLLPRVSWQNKDQQSQSGDQDTGDEQVDCIEEGPPLHHHCEGDIRIRFLAAVVLVLVHLPFDLWQKNSHLRTFESLRPTGPSYLSGPTLRWGCSWRYLPPTSAGPESSFRASRSQISGHISECRTGTSAHLCGRCSLRSLGHGEKNPKRDHGSATQGLC